MVVLSSIKGGKDRRDICEELGVVSVRVVSLAASNADSTDGLEQSCEKNKQIGLKQLGLVREVTLTIRGVSCFIVRNMHCTHRYREWERALGLHVYTPRL